jgi:hypothetical protein
MSVNDIAVNQSQEEIKKWAAELEREFVKDRSSSNDVVFTWKAPQKSIKGKEDGKLIAYNRCVMPPAFFIQYLTHEKVPFLGFVMTKKQERIKKVFERVMTPDLALELVEAGVKLESGG